MHRRNLLCVTASCLLALLAANPITAQAPPAPQTKLVLAIVVDQFRYDYLTRFGPELTGGLRRLWDQGAVFTNANYESWPTVTAVGHSQILSGATPSTSGIVGNDWWDRNEKKRVMSITDDNVQMLGGTGAAASPRRLLTTTVGDELKISGKGGKVIGVSLKDRSAILPAGHMADAAYWFNATNGNFVSSTYYMPALPDWVAQSNQAHPADKYAGKAFLNHALPAQPGAQLYAAVDASPYGDELVLGMALKVLSEEKLGTGPKIDLLSVSFSSVDYVGHTYGPDSPEIHAMVLAVDKVVGQLLDAVDNQVGAANVVAVFTADHGVSPVPEENIKRKLPGGRLNLAPERAAVEQALKEQFGEGKYVASIGESALYFEADPVPGRKIDVADLERVAASALRSQPHVARVYTRSGFRNGAAIGDRIDQRVRNGFHADRSPDVMILHDPYWLTGGPTGSTHGSPYSYDSHVPIIFLAPSSKIFPGHYSQDVSVSNIAPTLATLLGIATPSGAQTRALDEILK